MDSNLIIAAVTPLNSKGKEAAHDEGQSSKKPRTQSPFMRIPSDLLPSILSNIPIPHLQYRLANKEWNESIKILHSLGECQKCVVRSKSSTQLLSRMQSLTRQVDGQQQTTPWPLHWHLEIDHWSFQVASFLKDLEDSLIPYLDSVPSACCYTIDLSTPSLSSADEAFMIAEWCLSHSKPMKYIFYWSAHRVLFPSQRETFRFLNSPSMKHVTGIFLNHMLPGDEPLSASPFRYSETVSNLRSLVIQYTDFNSEDIPCIAHSPYLTNLTSLFLIDAVIFSDDDSEDDEPPPMEPPIGFDAVICSPIMETVRSLNIRAGYTLDPRLIEALAQSEFLKSVTDLTLHGQHMESLEPLVRCDATLPNLNSLTCSAWYQLEVAEAAMKIIVSPNSALFNRIKSLDFADSRISMESMKTLCHEGGGLKSLKRLNLSHTQVTDEMIQVLSSASRFSNLQRLDLSLNEYITNKSVLALCASDRLQSLEQVEFAYCPMIDSDALKQILTLPLRPNLRLLSFPFAVDDATKLQLQEELKRIAPQLTIKLWENFTWIKL